ncbi:MAG: hypothetical protein AAGD05_05935 [Bacteroidota bacterium]
MTPTLRKRHYLIWLLLIVLLPGLLIATALLRPQEFDQKNLPAAIPKALPTLLQSKEVDGLQANWRSHPDGTQQIEMLLSAPLRYPAATVFLGSQATFLPSQAQVLGQLGSGPVYRFNFTLPQVGNPAWHVHIYDPIKTQVIATFAF